MKAVKSLLALLVLAASLASVQTADAHSSGSAWRTEAWATAKVQRIHNWHGYSIDSEYSDCSIGGVIGYVDHFNRIGEQLYRHFRCNLMTYDGNHDFNVTVHALSYWPYFKVTAGWMHYPG